MSKQPELREDEIYRVIGAEGFAQICSLFYQQVQKDDILRPMYPTADMEGAERRLRQFLIYRFGGPQDYLEERGHPRLRMRHAPFPINQAARDRWMQLMSEAIRRANVDQAAAKTLLRFFDGMSTFLVNRLDRY